MFSSRENIDNSLGNFHIKDRMLRYSNFVPRLYNLCKSLGFTPGKIMPSRAFCSDESQGFPIILITRHFGTFPFNHGQVGGVVATDRHGPHSHHGKDLVIIQASHVGYDPASAEFGIYQRLQTSSGEYSSDCGKIGHVLDWYQAEYSYAQKNILLLQHEGQSLICIDNQLLNPSRDEGLFLVNEEFIEASSPEQLQPVVTHSTSRCFIAAENLVERARAQGWSGQDSIEIGALLTPDMFVFKRHIKEDTEGKDHLEMNLLPVMPWVVASERPLLTAAMVNTQVEFDRTYRTILRESSYQGKNILFVSGLNIDISPTPGQLFPLTKFIPWAAYLQLEDGSHRVMEQTELFEKLLAQSEDNPDQISLDDAMQAMEEVEEIQLSL